MWARAEFISKAVLKRLTLKGGDVNTWKVGRENDFQL
jgi:hypothetical protein